MQTLWQDLRYGARMMLKQPGFTLIAIITLTLGIGANTAIFSVVNGVLLKPLPYENPERLVLVWERFKQGFDQIPVSASEFVDYRSQAQVFEQLAAFNTNDYNLTGGDAPERIPGAVVTANLFPLLGVRPVRGRTFLDEENQVGRDNVVVISYALWQRRFGSDPDLISKTIELNGKMHQIVGIMPRGFQFPLPLFGIKGVSYTQPAELWTPLTFRPRQLQIRFSRFLGVIGKLRPGATLAQANAEVQAIADRMPRQYPNNYPSEGWSASAVSLHAQVVGKLRPVLFMLSGAVGFVLLIACANVANLLLARAASRRKELAIRAALGAGRFTLVRQLLTESSMLALLGGSLGVLLAWWGTDLLIYISPDTIPRMREIGLDYRVLGFTLLLSLLTGVLFSLAPVLQMLRLDLRESLKESGKGSTVSGGSQRLRHSAVVTEFALALALLIGAGLMIRSFARLLNVDPGFNARNVLTFQLSLPPAKYTKLEQSSAFYQQALERIKSLPGVKAAGAANILPLSGSNTDEPFIIEGRMPSDLSQVPDEEFRVVTPDYFKAMSVPLLEGRYFTEANRDQAHAVTIVNQALARKYFPGEDPLGKRITMSDPRQPNAAWLTIVGIVGDVKHNGLAFESAPEYYVPHPLRPDRAMNLVVRAEADPVGLAAAIRREVAQLDHDLPLYNTRTLERVIAESVAQQRLSTLLLGVFAVCALTLAAVGIYGVMAYLVTQRTHELGIRMALGAQQRDVLKLVIGQGMKLALMGVGVGLVAAFGLTRLMKSLLYSVSATDPLTFIITTSLLIMVSLLAALVPARRATKVDPMIALRTE